MVANTTTKTPDGKATSHFGKKERSHLQKFWREKITPFIYFFTKVLKHGASKGKERTGLDTFGLCVAAKTKSTSLLKLRHVGIATEMF